MAQSFDLLDQAERCRRLARDSADANARALAFSSSPMNTQDGAREDQDTQRRTPARTTPALPEVSKSARDAVTGP
jgi:hypothetical protein